MLLGLPAEAGDPNTGESVRALGQSGCDQVIIFDYSLSIPKLGFLRKVLKFWDKVHKMSQKIYIPYS